MSHVFATRRRPTLTVDVAGVTIGSSVPVRLQSMTNTPTMDTKASVEQAVRIAEAGADLVRLTAQGVREAENLASIRGELRRRGVAVPLVADIHFNRNAAFTAATTVEKVRINPGNFVDPGRTFRKLEYTDAEYDAELAKIEDVFGRFLDFCRENHTAVRLGVNHGSLSDRIMSRYGDTPHGMVESVMEFLRVAVRRGFMDIVISIKASNVVVMTETVRMLVKAMDAEDMHFPLHLGVTEAGDGEDGRVKSAVGIGTLLTEGLGDTIRVSLSEAPEAELPVARRLRDYVTSFYKAALVAAEWCDAAEDRVKSVPLVAAADLSADYQDDRKPDIGLTGPVVDVAEDEINVGEGPVFVSSSHANYPLNVAAAVHSMVARGIDRPVIACVSYDGLSADEVTVRASVDLGYLLLHGLVDGISINSGGALSSEAEVNLAYAILQAARRRITRTEYVACPGCGRTLFDLQTTLKAVKEATASLKGLKIGVMGCIVNGPGEMADADYGYVGAGVGRVSLYRRKECVRKNIPADEAIPALLELLRSDGITV